MSFFKIKKIKISSWQNYQNHKQKDIKYAQEKDLKNLDQYLKGFAIKEKDHSELKKIFPYFSVLEGYSIQFDYLCRLLWNKFGPINGECFDYYSEYPVCPLVLATEKTRKVISRNKDKEEYWTEIKEYFDPGKHIHNGIWNNQCLDKIGYDEFITVFYFYNEENKFFCENLAINLEVPLDN